MSEVLPPAIKGIGLSTLDNRKAQSILSAAQHNLRDVEGRGWAHKSDPARIHLNTVLAGPGDAKEVESLHAELMARAGYAPVRRDYTQAFELLFTTPSGFKFDCAEYFAWCLKWAVDNLGDGVVLSAVGHFDEGAPHLHILMAPIERGEWVGSNFARKTWPKSQAKFGRDVAALGLKLAPQLKGKALTEAAGKVKERLTELLAPHVTPDVLEALLKLAGRKPAGLVGPLGIKAGPAGDGGKAFKRIALSTGKGPKREREPIPYGFGSIPYGIENRANVCPENRSHYLCGGIEQSPPQSAPLPDSIQVGQEHGNAGIQSSTEPTAPVSTRPLSDIPNEDGEVAPPAPPAPALTSTQTTSDTLVSANAGIKSAPVQRLGSRQSTPAPAKPTSQARPQSTMTTPADNQVINQPALPPVSLNREPQASSDQSEVSDTILTISDATCDRDDRQDPGDWCEELGEFVKAPIAKKPMRSACAQIEFAADDFPW